MAGTRREWGKLGAELTATMAAGLIWCWPAAVVGSGLAPPPPPTPPPHVRDELACCKPHALDTASREGQQGHLLSLLLLAVRAHSDVHPVALPHVVDVLAWGGACGV